MRRIALLVVLAACSHIGSKPGGDNEPDPGTWDPPLGATWHPDGTEVVFRLASTRATRIELWIYATPTGDAEHQRVVMERESGDVWRARVLADLLPPTIYYGYRV
jgi:pullulanase/glycogen debranching enzyme